MSYIGNEPRFAAFVTDQFNGNGSTTVYTMSVAPANTASILVAVSGVLQDPSTYSVNGTTLTFSGAPPTGTGNISVRYMGIPASGVTTTAYRTVTEFTATANQTTFTVPSYTVGYIDVYRNGVRLGSADFTASNGTTVVLAIGATAGDLITFENFYVSSVLNAISNTPKSVGWSNLPTGSVLQVVSSTKTNVASFTTSTFTDVTGLSVSITPKFSTSKFLVIANIHGCWHNAAAKIGGRLMRDSTPISVGDSAANRISLSAFSYFAVSGDAPVSMAVNYLDSPATSSTITYKWQANNLDGAGTVYINSSYTDTNSAIFGRTASTITVMEIAG